MYHTCMEPREVKPSRAGNIRKVLRASTNDGAQDTTQTEAVLTTKMNVLKLIL